MNKFYIYKYFIGNKLFYIGKSRVPLRRYNTHLYENPDLFENVDRIEVCEFHSKDEADFFEKYYICLEKPELNLREKSYSIQSLGINHIFTSYGIDEFIQYFTEEEKKKGYVPHERFVFRGKEYKYENDFVRECFPDANLRAIKHLRERIKNKYRCKTKEEAYEIMLSMPLESFYVDYEHKKIEDYIKEHPDLKYKELAKNLGVSFNKVRDIKQIMSR